MGERGGVKWLLSGPRSLVTLLLCGWIPLWERQKAKHRGDLWLGQCRYRLGAESERPPGTRCVSQRDCCPADWPETVDAFPSSKGEMHRFPLGSGDRRGMWLNGNREWIRDFQVLLVLIPTADQSELDLAAEKSQLYWPSLSDFSQPWFWPLADQWCCFLVIDRNMASYFLKKILRKWGELGVSKLEQ